MADTHIQGPVSDAGVTPPQGANVASVISQRFFPLVFGNEDITKQLCTIEATIDQPVFVEIDAYVETVFNRATTNTFNAGNAGNGTAYITGATINPATLGYQSGGNGSKVLLRARTIITARVTGTGAAATTGKMSVIIRATGVGKGVHITTV